MMMMMMMMMDGWMDDDDDNTPTNSSKLKESITSHIKRDRKIYKKRSVKNKVHKALILGDSHARGCASEVMNQLNNEYEVSGFINPGSEMKNIKESAKTKMVQLTNDDIVVLWGGVQMMLSETILWWV
jgi:hypothetical protein